MEAPLLFSPLKKASSSVNIGRGEYQDSPMSFHHGEEESNRTMYTSIAVVSSDKNREKTRFFRFQGQKR